MNSPLLLQLLHSRFLISSCEDKCVIHHLGISSFSLAPSHFWISAYAIKIHFPGREDLKCIWLQSDVLDSQAWIFESSVVIVTSTTIERIFTESLTLAETSGDHLVPPPCLKQDEIEQVAQDIIQLRFGSALERRVHSWSFSLMFVWNFFYLPNALSVGSSEKSLACCLRFSPSHIYIHWRDAPWATSSSS